MLQSMKVLRVLVAILAQYGSLQSVLDRYVGVHNHENTGEVNMSLT